MHIFGPVSHNRVHLREATRAAGFLELAHADVRWYLSVDRNDLPAGCPPDKTTYRAITIDGEEIEFSGGFENLHTQSYRAVLAGGGFGLDDARPAVEVTSEIRSAPVTPTAGDAHPILRATSA